MRTKKVTVQESPVLSPDRVAIGKKKKGGSIEYKTLKLFANVAKVQYRRNDRWERKLIQSEF